MGKPTLATEGNLKRARLLLNGLDEFNKHEHSISHNDQIKINKITKYINDHKNITAKQFKSLTHYTKVYDIKISQAIDFIID